MNSSHQTKECEKCGKEYREVLKGIKFCSGDCEKEYYERLQSGVSKS